MRSKGNKVAKAWWAILLLSTLLSLNGLCLASVFGWSGLGKLLTIAAIFLLTIGSSSLGCAMMLEGLTGEIRHIPDNKEDVTITLKIGPFSYSKAIPTEKTD